MSFDNSYTAVTGATYQASDFNTGVKGNFTAIWVGSAPGDMDYYTSATAKSRLALTTGGLLYGGASAPAWLALTAGGLLYGGASAPAWLANVAGGLLYGGASAPAYLAKGTSRQLLRAGASYPEYGSLVYRRQGGDASNWQTAGASNYTPTLGDMQVGSISVTAGSTAAVTYPVAFAQRPVIMLSVNASSGWYEAHWSDDSVSGFTIRLSPLDGGSGAKVVNWLAIGQI